MADDAAGSDPWAAKVEMFVDRYYDSMRGRVRTHVIDQHLRDHLDAAPGPVVDIGGGAGTQSLPLARRGYEVTIADPSAAMLDRARRSLAAEAPQVADRVTLVQVDSSGAVAQFGRERFAGVLCHAVIPYVDEPGDLISALSALCRPGGTVSLMAINAATMAVRAGFEERWDDALRGFDADAGVNELGLAVQAHTLDRLEALFRTHDVDPVTWYGVRLFVEMWPRDRGADGVDTAAVYAVELEASRRDPYRKLSRLLHLLGTKRDG